MTTACCDVHPVAPTRQLTARAMGAGADAPYVRASAVLVEDGRMLLVRQQLRERTRWNLPGGHVEEGEDVAQALAREVREETGLVVEAGDVLYVTDRRKALGNLVIDVCVQAKRVGGALQTCAHSDGAGERIACARMVPLDELEACGMGGRLAVLAREGFPMRGYRGEFHAWYGA